MMMESIFILLLFHCLAKGKSSKYISLFLKKILVWLKMDVATLITGLLDFLHFVKELME